MIIECSAPSGDSVRLHFQTSTYELIELHTEAATMSNHSGLRSRQQMKRCDSQLLSPAADAADTSLTQLNGDVEKRQSELELIKKAKHNRGNGTVNYGRKS